MAVKTLHILMTIFTKAANLFALEFKKDTEFKAKCIYIITSA